MIARLPLSDLLAPEGQRPLSPEQTAALYEAFGSTEPASSSDESAKAYDLAALNVYRELTGAARLTAI